MNMGDMDDNLIPELEARYDPKLRGDITDTENYGAKDTTGKKFNIRISRTYPILREFTHTGVRGDTYLIEQNGLESVLKFYRSDIVPNEAVIRKAKKISERLHNFIIRIYEYGYDENTKRWYAIEEYAKYGSLKDLIELNINLNVLNLVVKETIERLKILHENNILHLNLKPSNILIRENQPLQLVFTDFDISSIIESEHMKNITPLIVRPLYSSPELLTGIVGREADYWSLGMIILELLLGRHLFGNLDDESIIGILSKKDVSIPEHISEYYKILLRGLLTKNPKKRWGYAEVTRWLERDTNIPFYFSDAPEEPKKIISKGHTVPYRFLNKEYCSLKEMIPAFLESEEAWEAAKDHLHQDNISKWLLKNSDEETVSKVNNIWEQSVGDPDLAVISLTYTFKNDLPFIFYGKLISREKLYIYASRSLKNETSKGEGSIINCLLNGKLIEYYREYMMLTSKVDDELISLFEAIRKAVSRKENYHEKLNTLFKMLDILATPLAYVLPAKISDNLFGNLDFITGNIDVVITREKYNEMIGDLIMPEEMKEEINNALSSEHPLEYLKGLEKLKESSLLTRGELNELQDEYILPVWLEGDLIGKETSRYMTAIKLLKKLKREGLFIKKNDFLDYLRKYSRFIGHVVDQNGFAQHNQKGETLEQRWIRLLKCDIGYEDYIKLARYIKNNVVLSMISHVEEILKRVSTQTVSSDSLNEIIKYLGALKSGEVKWDDTDNQIVNEIHSLIFRKKNAPIQFIEKITEGVLGKFLQTFMKIVLVIDADERTREKESSLAGGLVGIFIGFIAWIIIANLELETSFYGPTVLGLLLGLMRKSIPLSLLFASAGFAGAFFLGLETLIEVIYAFPIAIMGAARIGASLGRRINKFSFYDDLFSKYNGRINDVVNAAEAASQ
jgi:serine/threonine protein kinase